MRPAFPWEEEEEILKLEARKRIYDIVVEFSGIHFREIERRCGLSTGLVKYHLGYLTKKEMVSYVRDGKSMRYYPKGFRAEDRGLMGILRQETARRIILLLMVRDRAALQEISQSIGLSPSTVHFHLGKLEERKVVTREGDGKAGYRLIASKDDIMGLLITYRRSFLDSLVDNMIEMWDFR